MIGRQIKHPLQDRVDAIIEKVLGTAYKPGAKISLHEFIEIKNTGYVRKRLEERAFALAGGSRVRYVYQIAVSDIPQDDDIKPCDYPKYGKEDVLNRLRQDGVVSNKDLNKSERNKLSRTIAYLRKSGCVIESKRDWSRKAGTAVTTYKLKTSNSGELSEAC